jgi:hypothetical protein
MNDLFSDDPPMFLKRTPHGHHDAEKICTELHLVGFTEAKIDTIAHRSRADSARDPAIGYCQGSPLRNEIEARDASRPSGGNRRRDRINHSAVWFGACRRQDPSACHCGPQGKRVNQHARMARRTALSRAGRIGQQMPVTGPRPTNSIGDRRFSF